MAQEKMTQTTTRKKEGLRPMVMEADEPQPKPRALDILMDLYVKIGGVLGVTAAAGTFLLICVIAFRLFYSPSHGFLFLAAAACATLIAAITAAVSVFLSVSMLWLPLLLGIAACMPSFVNLALRIRDSLLPP